MIGSAPAPAAPEGEDYQDCWICAPRRQCCNSGPPSPPRTPPPQEGPGSEWLG